MSIGTRHREDDPNHLPLHEECHWARANGATQSVADTKPADLIEAVRVVAGGEALLSPSVTRTLIAEFAARAKQPTRPRSTS